MKCRIIFFMMTWMILNAFPTGVQGQGILTLQSALTLARENNPSMVEARKRLHIAEVGITKSKRLANPELDVDVEKEVRLSQPLQTWGKRGLSVGIASDEFTQAEYRLEDLWQDVARRIKGQYYEALLQQKNIQLARDHWERAQRLFEQVNIRFNAGKARNHELARARLELANARNAFFAAETNFSVSIGRLNILLGQPMHGEFTLEDNLTLTRIKGDMEELLEAALKNRPDILEQDQEIAKKEKELRLAKRQWLPDVTLGVFLDQEDEMSDVGAGLSFEIPLWNQFQEDIEEASLEKEIAESGLEALKREATVEVYAAYKNAELARQSVLNLEEAIREANELLRILTIEYEEGQVTFLVYLEGLTSYRETKQSYLSTLVNYRDKIADLEQAVGRSLIQKEGR